MVDNRKLNIIDENGNITGEESEKISTSKGYFIEKFMFGFTHRKARFSFNIERKTKIHTPIY